MTVLEEIKGHLATMPLSDQVKVLECYGLIKKTIIAYDEAGIMAIALIGAEFQQMTEDEENG